MIRHGVAKDKAEDLEKDIKEDLEEVQEILMSA
jgi:hypothetical protein